MVLVRKQTLQAKQGVATMSKLNATTISKAKPTDKPYKLSDGNSLFLLINPAPKKNKDGSKLWRFNYRHNGKQKQISLGIYPDIKLAVARQLCQEARELVAVGVDPSVQRKAHKKEIEALAANSFEVIAREFIKSKVNQWSIKNTEKVIRQLEVNIFPWIGKTPIAKVTAPELLAVLRRMEARGILESAHRLRATCGQVFRYAIATGRTEYDIAASLSGAMVRAKKKHLPAITDPNQVAQLLRAIDSLESTFTVYCALRLAPLVFLRPGELRSAEWSEIDFKAELWNLPAEKMKMKEPHIVPLSKQAIAIFKEIQPLTGSGRYVFPGARSTTKPISNMAIGAALRRLGYEQGTMTPHGFRAMARTILDEVLQERVDLIEHQLAHAVKDPNGRAYNRTSHLEGRKKMMQRWSNYLDGLKAGAQVIPFKANG